MFMNLLITVFVFGNLFVAMTINSHRISWWPFEVKSPFLLFSGLLFFNAGLILALAVWWFRYASH